MVAGVGVGIQALTQLMQTSAHPLQVQGLAHAQNPPAPYPPTPYSPAPYLFASLQHYNYAPHALAPPSPYPSAPAVLTTNRDSNSRQHEPEVQAARADMQAYQPAILANAGTSASAVTPSHAAMVPSRAKNDEARRKLAPDVPEPPADCFLSLSSADALDKIIGHWDRSKSEWQPEHDWIKVGGEYVQLKDYPTLYKQTLWWKRIRNRYCQWLVRNSLVFGFTPLNCYPQALVSEYEIMGGKDEFWKKYSDPKSGQKFLIKHIMSSIADQREQEAQRIRASFGKDFSEHFSSRGNVMQDAASIIARYKDLSRRRPDIMPATRT